MAKAKAKSKDATARPPRSLGEAVLVEALAQINEQTCSDYVGAIFSPTPPKSKKQSKASCLAIMKLAAVGFALYQHQQSLRRDATPSPPSA